MTHQRQRVAIESMRPQLMLVVRYRHAPLTKRHVKRVLRCLLRCAANRTGLQMIQICLFIVRDVIVFLKGEIKRTQEMLGR